MILDPLHGDGYQFWSGIGSGSPILLLIAAWWRHHNCRVPGCWRLTLHRTRGSARPSCRKHLR